MQLYVLIFLKAWHSWLESHNPNSFTEWVASMQYFKILVQNRKGNFYFSHLLGRESSKQQHSISLSVSLISLLGLCFSSEGLHGAPTTGRCLRLPSCMALGSSALEANMAAGRVRKKSQIRKKPQCQDATLMYWSFKGHTRKHNVNLQMGKIQIITPDMVLTLHQCDVLHCTENAPTAIMDMWVGSSEVLMVHWNSRWVGCHVAAPAFVNLGLTYIIWLSDKIFPNVTMTSVLFSSKNLQVMW